MALDAFFAESQQAVVRHRNVVRGGLYWIQGGREFRMERSYWVAVELKLRDGNAVVSPDVGAAFDPGIQAVLRGQSPYLAALPSDSRLGFYLDVGMPGLERIRTEVVSTNRSLGLPAVSGFPYVKVTYSGQPEGVEGGFFHPSLNSSFYIGGDRLSAPGRLVIRGAMESLARSRSPVRFSLPLHRGSDVIMMTGALDWRMLAVAGRDWDSWNVSRGSDSPSFEVGEKLRRKRAWRIVGNLVAPLAYPSAADLEVDS